MTTRARITTDHAGRVTLSYDGDDGRRVERTFTAPDGRDGYVRELDGQGGDSQPCGGLYRTGTTLMCSRQQLPMVIRREWRARRRHEATILRSRY